MSLWKRSLISKENIPNTIETYMYTSIKEVAISPYNALSRFVEVD